MNKTININLGGRAFVIDEDAYAKLDYYLTSIHDYFKNSEGYEEITNDIESRMGELFADNLRGRSIISTADVDYAIHTMGSLEDFGVDTAGTQANFNTGQRSGGIKTGRRIFRDPDEKILGGVCAGLSSYFGINDPIWLRIIFLLLFFVAGTGFLFYMILWILIPKAVTSADRLSMKGEPININNIAKEVEDSFNHFGQRINDIGREFSGKKKNSLNANEPYAFSGITNFVGELIEALQYIIPKIIKGFIILIGLICMFAIATAGIALLTSGFLLHDYSSLMFGPGMFSKHWLFATSLILVFLIPAVALIVLGLKTFFQVKTPSGLLKGLGFAWMLFFLLGIFSSVNFARSFKSHAEVSKANEYFAATMPDTLVIDINENETFDSGDFDNIQLGELRTKNGKFYSDNIHIRVLKSDDQNIYWKVNLESNGSSTQEAESLANSILYPIGQDGSRLIFPGYFEIIQGKVWRDQDVRVNVYVPEGKYLKVTSRAENFVYKIEKDPEQESSYEYSGKIWRMGKAGFVNTSPKENTEESEGQHEDTAEPQDTL